MKYIKEIAQINESMTSDMVMKLTQIARNPLNLNNYYMMTGEVTPQKDEYYAQVEASCMFISMDYLQVSEKDFSTIDKLKEAVTKSIIERQDEFDTIIHNCKQRKFRAQYCAETEFHTIIQGRLDALMQRSEMMGGFAKQTQLPNEIS